MFLQLFIMNKCLKYRFKMADKSFIKEILENIINEKYTYNTKLKIDSLQIKTKKFTLKQYYTLNQSEGNFCGFHSLFNMLNFIKFLKTKNRVYIDKMNNNWKFYKFYFKTLNYILNNMQLQKSAIKSLITRGPLERYQFKFLISNNKKIISQFSSDENYDISILQFFYGFNRFNGTINEAINFQNGINNFLNNNNKKKILIIILGIVNHWNLLVIERNIDNINKYYFLDSRNYFTIFNIDYENFESESMKEIVNYYIGNCKTRNNRNPSSWSINCFKVWIKDMNKSLEIIFDILNQKMNLFDMIINENVDIFINSFEETTLFNLDNDINLKCNENIEKVFSFMKNNYLPSLFEGEIYLYFIQFQYKSLNKIISWNKFIKILMAFNYVITYKEKSKNDDETNEFLNKYKILIKYFLDKSKN